MQNLNKFISLLEGRFDNKEQSEKNTGVPYCEHINSILNSKIRNLPENFQGIFLLEESYYTTKGNTHASPHIFLFTVEYARKLPSFKVAKELHKILYCSE